MNRILPQHGTNMVCLFRRIYSVAIPDDMVFGVEHRRLFKRSLHVVKLQFAHEAIFSLAQIIRVVIAVNLT
ncbi:hypothetical protein D3C73_1194720 [compost metagenome]